MQKLFKLTAILVLLTILAGAAGVTAIFLLATRRGLDAPVSTNDGLVFIHHSVGANWLGDGLHEALLAKDYIGTRNDIYYGTDVLPDAGRPDSLGLIPGDFTDMNHWVFWFNDYVESIKLNRHGLTGRLDRLFSDQLPWLKNYYYDVKREHSANGFNRIIMFKSCFPLSDIEADGAEPANPFSLQKTIANYQALYRHPDGPGSTYTYNGNTYKPLEDIFAANPDVLFVIVTAPPIHYAPGDDTTDENAHRARQFNNWLKNEWLVSYNSANPDLNNVAVFDMFDQLAYADNHSEHPNRLRPEFGGESGDSHPNQAANVHLTQVFATNPDNFLDQAWQTFSQSNSQLAQESLLTE